MYKALPIVALIFAVVAAATLIPSTSQAFLSPVWVPFEGGFHSGFGFGGFGAFGGSFNKGYHAGYAGYGYGGSCGYGCGYGYGRYHRAGYRYW
jgi:hypothetical protein